MKYRVLALVCFFISINTVNAQADGWISLFDADLTNAEYPEGIWSFEDGVLTATEDECIWSVENYSNFMLDLEFKTAEGTNSGVIVYCTDTKNWIPNSVEIQIADDFAEKWATANKSWQCAAIFGHLPARESRVKKPGEWNKMRITCVGQIVEVELNGKKVTEMNMAYWTSGKVNPDGSDIPSWLPTPFAELKTAGKIGLQGKHAGAPIWFRNILVKKL